MQETTRGQGTSDAGLSVQATEVEAGKGKAENQTRVTRADVCIGTNREKLHRQTEESEAITLGTLGPPRLPLALETPIKF